MATISQLPALWDAVLTRRGLARFPGCSAKQCRRKGAYVCRSCGKAYCGHCAPHKIAVDDERFPEAERATCICHSCGAPKRAPGV